MTDVSDQPVADEPVLDAEGVDSSSTDHDQPELDADGNPVQAPEDDSEEVEWEDGQKYRVPKPLKDALLRQADYTRKTQDVAEQRRELEQRQQTLAQQAQAQQAYLDDVADLRAVSKQVDAYANVDWAALRAQDPDAAQEHFFTYQQLRDARDELQRGLQTKVQERTAQQEREIANRMAAGRAELSKIPGWNQETETKVAAFARGEGFNQRELGEAVLDPRIGKVLHKAFLWDQHQQQQAKAKSAERKAEVPAPAPKVGGQSAGPGKSILDKAKAGDVEAVRARMNQLAGGR